MWQVIARITQLTRPALCLSEVLSQPELEQLLMLMCDSRYNTSQSSWGGAWAGHAISCMLQDVLEGERLSPQLLDAASGATGGGGAGGSVSITDDEALASSLPYSSSHAGSDESSQQPSAPAAAIGTELMQGATGGPDSSVDSKDGDVIGELCHTLITVVYYLFISTFVCIHRQSACAMLSHTRAVVRLQLLHIHCGVCTQQQLQLRQP